MQYVDKGFKLSLLVLAALPNPLQLQLKGETYLLQPFDGDADPHVRSFLLQITMTMLEEPQNGFGSNAALFHGTRNPLRACRKLAFKLEQLLKTLSLGNSRHCWRLAFAENADYSVTPVKKLLITSAYLFQDNSHKNRSFTFFVLSFLSSTPKMWIAV
jgi:hypothetical protein